jgi:hypothetical protein
MGEQIMSQAVQAPSISLWSFWPVIIIAVVAIFATFVAKKWLS